MEWNGMERIASMYDKASETTRGDDTLADDRLRGRLVEASIAYHRADEALSRTYAEIDRLASRAGAPWSREWCRVVELCGLASLDRAGEVHERAREAWEALVSEALGDDLGDIPRRLLTADEVAALLVFALGRGDRRDGEGEAGT
jgi:hypothetical protein